MRRLSSGVMRLRAALRPFVSGAVLAFAGLAALEAQAPTPRLLAPGVVSTGDIEFGPALTPDGQTLYFSKGSPGMKRAMSIVVSRLQNGASMTPEIAPFSGRYNDIDPTTLRTASASSSRRRGRRKARPEEGLRSLGHGAHGDGLERADESGRARQQRRLGDHDVGDGRRDALHRGVGARERAADRPEALPLEARERPL